MATTKKRSQKKALEKTAPDVVEVPEVDDGEQRVVAVTGAYSFIGANLIRRLEADRRYYKVLALDIRKPEGPLHKTQFHRVDLTMPTADAEVSAILRREGVDTLVHCAFLSEPTHQTAFAHELESVGTMHILSAVAEAKLKRLVVASQTVVYGATPSNPNYLAESSELRGVHSRSRFVRDKADAEVQIRRFRGEHPNLVLTVLRTAPILGPTIRNWVTRFFARPVAPMMMGHDPLIQLVHENDVVDAFHLAVDVPTDGEFNVVGPGVLPYSMILSRLGRVPLPLPYRLAYPLSRLLWATQIYDTPPNFLDFLRYVCVADGTRADAVLGFRGRYEIRQTIDDFLGLPVTLAADPLANLERSDEPVLPLGGNV